jgi:hypothetical protein
MPINIFDYGMLIVLLFGFIPVLLTLGGIIISTYFEWKSNQRKENDDRI